MGAKVKSWTEKLYDIFGDADKVKGVYVPSRKSLRVLPENVSAFDETKVVQRRLLFDLKSSYGTSALRDVITTSGSAAVSNSSTGEIMLNTGTTASSTARLDSAKRIRYISGFPIQVGTGIRIPTLPTGNIDVKWGVRQPDGLEGAYHGVDATGYYAAVIRNGTEQRFRQGSFSINNLDGVDEPRLTLDLTRGNITELEFVWYGYGPFRWSVAGVPVGANKQEVIPTHLFEPSGSTSIQSPNLPIFVEVTNGGDATDFEVYVGGRQASVIGDYRPIFRTTGQERIGVSTSTTSVPLVSFRDKVGFEDHSVLVDGASASVSSADHIIEIYVNPTLTGASWVNPTNHTAAETAVETDISATALSGGTLVKTFYVVAGNPSQPSGRDITADTDIPENQTVTMAARTVSGTGTVDAFFRMKEEW